MNSETVNCKAGEVITTDEDEEAECLTVKCECCSLSEECTWVYVQQVKKTFCGRWVCGLCGEATKELQNKMIMLSSAPGGDHPHHHQEEEEEEEEEEPSWSMKDQLQEEALQSHMAICESFRTKRKDPELYLVHAMSDLARKISQRRSSSSFQYSSD